MKNYTKKQARAARGLAVAYHAFLVANDKQDENGLSVWSKMLRDRQQETGVEMVRDITLISYK